MNLLIKSLLIISVAHQVSARTDMLTISGGHDGNGGDICENKINNIVHDIEQWLLNDKFKGIHLPPPISESQYKAKMLKAIQKTDIRSCTSDKIYVNKVEKTCMNFESRKGGAEIVCNFDRLMKTSFNDSYLLIHHELAGIAGLETNNGDEKSDYKISNQITEYLKKEVVTKLGIKNESKYEDTNIKKLSQSEHDFFRKNVLLELISTKDIQQCSKNPFGSFHIETLVENSNLATLNELDANSSVITFISHGSSIEFEFKVSFLISNNLEVIEPLRIELYKLSKNRVDRNGIHTISKELIKSKLCEKN